MKGSQRIKKGTKGKLFFFLAALAIAMLYSSIFAAAQPSIKIEPREITKKVKLGNFIEVPIKITNDGNVPLSLRFDIDGIVSQYAVLDKSSANIEPSLAEQVKMTVYAENLTSLSGQFLITGTVEDSIPVEVNVTDLASVPVEALLIDIEPITERAIIGDVFKYKIGLQNLLSEKTYNVTISSSIDRLIDESTYKFEKSFFTESEVIELGTSRAIVKEFNMPDFIKPGSYVINVKADYLGLSSSASRRFRVGEKVWDYAVLGILPVRWIAFFSFFVLLGGAGVLFYFKRKAKNKRYVVKIDYNLLPKPAPRNVMIGFIAETTKKAYFDIDALTTHTLIAGSTGGGKTVSAEVLVEEALLKGAAVIVFDPTAQWTGFLRKNVDKKMFALYQKYGMKKTDARAFNGNVRQILNAREVIEIKKYIKPGEINVFSVSKLDPEDIDLLVANTVRQVFHANLNDCPELKLLIIFDEVHRLLPKFGGSGEGFIQIERAAREFRKWGVGLILISQVLTDFVGETKANINTEIQMRTRDQGDLERIKNKYGGYMLQSLLKSATGTGMLENAGYNKGNPWFVAFRPLLHEHARLSDEELENYNKYNEMIDDLEYQLEQLEKYGIDVFDLKLELKMALDKVKSGSFNMVNIYLEGLIPRIKSNWDKIGKTPEKRKLKLVTESELREELDKAKEARKKFEEGQSKVSSKVQIVGGVKLFKLKNGIIVSKVNELINGLEELDENQFKGHLENGKNEIYDWLLDIDKELAEKIKDLKTLAETRTLIKKIVDARLEKAFM